MSKGESHAGVKTAEDGSSFVGGSVRPDGSVRKTYKVRPGYTPPEDVQRYQPRAKRLQQEISLKKSPENTQPPVQVAIDAKDKSEFPLLGSGPTKATETKAPESKTLHKETLNKAPQASPLSIDDTEKLLEGLSISSKSDTTAQPQLYMPPWKRKSQK